MGRRHQVFAWYGARVLSIMARARQRQPWLSIAVVVALGVAFAWWAYVRWDSHRVLLDDAFISFRYAYNLVHGRGLVYNVGERVEGYTNFLWVLVAAAALRFDHDPIGVTRNLGVASYLAATVIAVWVAARAPSRSALRRLPAIALASLMALPDGLPSFAGTGMETSFVGLLILSLGVVGLLTPPGPWACVLAATLPLVALLTRMDTALAITAYGAIVLLRPGLMPKGRGRLRHLLVRFAPSVCGFSVYLAWKYAYYGAILPNTYYAKAAYVTRFDAGTAYVCRFVQSYPSVLVLVVLAAYGLAATRDRRRGAFLSYSLLASALQVIYVAKVGGDFMEYRLLWEYWPLLVCAGALGAIELASRSFFVTAAAACIAVGTTMSPTVLESRFYMQSLDEMNGYASVAQEIGPVLERSLPPGTIVATTLAGAAYFMPSITVIDQWGLNDRFVGQGSVREVHGRGHIKFAPEPYLRERGVNLYLEHPVICDCDHPCWENKPDVFVRLGVRKDCLRGSYMTPNPSLTHWFCSNPAMFVVGGLDCR